MASEQMKYPERERALHTFFLRGYQQRTGIAFMHLSFSKKIPEKQFESVIF